MNDDGLTTEPVKSGDAPSSLDEGTTAGNGDDLSRWRAEIDRLDGELLALLAERQQVVQHIGEYKRAQGLPPLDMDRWQRLLARITAKAATYGLCEDFVSGLYNHIHEYSLTLESENS